LTFKTLALTLRKNLYQPSHLFRFRPSYLQRRVMNLKRFVSLHRLKKNFQLSFQPLTCLFSLVDYLFQLSSKTVSYANSTPRLLPRAEAGFILAAIVGDEKGARVEPEGVQLLQDCT
jgi:hypothetical protein